MDELLKWRKEFPILEKTVYLISHSLGAMPRKVYERLKDYADMWATRGIRAWAEGWWEMPITTGNLIGKIISAPPDTVVMHQNVSVAVAIILSSLDFHGKRAKIVYSDMEFPSVMYVCERFAGYGAKNEVVKSKDGLTLPYQELLAAINEETALVVVSHVLFKSSSLVDVKRIIAHAHAVGAKVLLDAYQSAGTVPLNVRALDVDFVVGGSVKWLCGGPGAGYLYVRPDLWKELEPRITGWMAHAEPFAFEPAPIRYADNSFRFLHGSPHIPAFYAAESGYEIINEIGVDKIREKSVRQTTRLIALADEQGFKINCPRNSAERGGTVVIDVPHGQAVATELNRRDFLVDYRPKAGIRIAPHFYTQDEELTLVIQEIKNILATKAYDQHRDARGKY